MQMCAPWPDMWSCLGTLDGCSRECQSHQSMCSSYGRMTSTIASYLAPALPVGLVVVDVA